MNYSVSFKTAFSKNMASAQQNRIFWLLITCFLVFTAFFGYFLFCNYINVLLSANFAYVRFAFLLIFLAGAICLLNPKKFSGIGCYVGFIAAAFGIKSSLTLWTIHKFSQTKEFFIQEKSFSNLVSCFFNVSQNDNSCALKTTADSIFSSYAISMGDFTNILKINTHIFISISILFFVLYFYKKVKA
ncbi:MAG: hypothetical protein LBT96_01320 [Campylobacteraceae bacterium]|nr:hypothetical protein [Campylobacteraceae bacterium]